MTPVLWILFFVSLSSEIDVERSVIQSYIDDAQDVLQYQFACRTSAKCTTCAKKSFISRVLNCGGSEKHDEVCTYEAQPQAWNIGCSLLNFYDLLPYWQNDTSKSTYWYPAKRYVQYGPYEFVMWGSMYGISVADKLNISLSNVTNVFTKDCLIQDAKTSVIVPEFCEAKHKRNCSITRSEQRELCSSSCIYCSDTYSCLTKNSFCTKGYLPLIEKYALTGNACSVCSRNLNNCVNQVDMILSFNKMLYLTIYYPECIFKKGHPDYIYCFTDASDQLRKRVTLTVDFNHTLPSHGNRDSFIVYRVMIEEYMGVYWCEAKGYGNDVREYKSNSIIAFKTMKGSEFAVRLIINDICNYTDCDSVNELDFLIDDVKDPIERNNFGKVRIMRVNAFYNDSFADIIIHVSTLSKRPGILADFYKLQVILRGYPDYIKVLYVKSSERCLPEFYKNLTWPAARQFQTVLPSELCVQKNGSPVTRFCEGDFLFGLNWGSVVGECSDGYDFNENTLLLQSFQNQSISKDLIQNVSEIVHSGNLTLIDLFFVSQILDKSTELTINCTLLDVSLNVVSGLLISDWDLLLKAQERLNITDSYLRASEIMAVNMTNSHTDLLTLQKDNVIFHSFNPIIQNASGFVMYRNYTINEIPLLGSFEDIEDIENTKLALYVSAEDIEIVRVNNLTNVSIVALIYLNDRLFPSNTSNTADLVINVNILNYEYYLKNPIPLLVRSDLNTNFNCAFWDYGDMNLQKRGNWSSFGSIYDGRFKNYSYLQICSYSHLTHLALLVMNKQNDTSLEGANDYVLSLLTALGSFLSVAGILGIFLTSCLFRSWRDKTGTQILLHLSVAILFEIIFMYMNGLQLFDCAIAGCLLQYVIISKFAWMLIYAFCQYLRFVRVFGPMPNHLVLKSIIVGWGFGIIPTVTVVIINRSTYYREKFCYPNGNYLFLGLYMPIAIVLIINLYVFCKIMCEVTNNKLDKFHSTNLKTQHIKLAVLLFSVLGIPWCFGLISNLIPFDWLKSIFVYIFVISSVIQGFLMFLFYVIFNKETRESWNKILFGKKKSYEMFSSKKTNSVSSVS